jgi:penicillin amidase
MRFAHPFGDGEGPIGRLLERLLSRRVEVGGGQEAVNATGYVPHDGRFTAVWGPSYRLLADIGDPDRSRWQHMTGQSGHPGSDHYDDLIADWAAGRTQPDAQPPVATLRIEPA